VRLSQRLPWRRRTGSDVGVEARKASFERIRSATSHVAVELDDLVFLVSTRDRLGRGLFVYGGRQDFDVLERVLRILAEHGVDASAKTLVEVGANIGTTTVAAVRHHRFAQVVALEPEPGNFRVLRLNLVANDIDSHVHALQVAASDVDGEARLRVSTRSSGLHELVAAEEDDPADTVVVRAVTLDTLAREGVFTTDEVGLLWLDAAGGEAPVLAGAATLVATGVPVVAAVRPGHPGWERARDELVGLLSGYTHFADVRREHPVVSRDLPTILDSITAPADVLAFRPATAEASAG
jgi:FkbM family methyltransferase